MTYPPYYDAAPSYTDTYLWPALKNIIRRIQWPEKRAFERRAAAGFAKCHQSSALT